MSEVESVTVRMYRDLLGDCFLLRIREQNGPERRILIDCGLLQGLANGADRIRAVADDIVATCSGDGGEAFVDLLVATHQHFDHVGGFIQARDVLLGDKLTYGELWMAWTEDPNDEKAKSLRDAIDDRKTAIVRLASAPKQGRALALNTDGIAGLDGFIGPLALDGAGTGGGTTGKRPRLTVASVMDALKLKAKKVRYLQPGQVVATPGDAPLSVAVLGPPKADSRLFKDLPSRGEGRETYLAEESANLSLLALAGPGEEAMLDLDSPFPKKYWKGLDEETVSKADGAADDQIHWLRDRYFAEIDPVEQRPQSFRRIDGNWIDPVKALALNLDSDTNNTSLVLAFRLPDGSFMLFAADAQVGNWLSWHDQTYRIEDEELTAEQILARTRLYKIGHHGSHNATLRGKGLEMMTHQDLVTMVSTVEEEARQQGKGWLMPDEKVKAPVLAHCNGRFLRGDRIWAEDPDTAPFRAANPKFGGRLTEGPKRGDKPLYVELRML